MFALPLTKASINEGRDWGRSRGGRRQQSSGFAALIEALRYRAGA